MAVYSFDQQYEHGERGEAFLDAFFANRGHVIQPATRGQQRRGIDRVFLWDGKMARVEYKTDFLAHETGKVFVETVSVDTEGKEGWATSSQADLLVYYVPGLRRIVVMPLVELREALPAWSEQYPTRPAQNVDYATHGVLVPIREFERHASQIFEIPAPDPPADRPIR
jgi:hypothetical protein